MPGLETDRGPRSRLILVAQIASLLATGAAVWHNVLIPRLLLDTAGGLMIEALLYSIFAWGWSFLIALELYLAFSLTDRSELVPEILRTSSAAVWFAPAIILLSSLSPGAIVAALVLVVSATRLLYSEWLRVRPAPRPAPPPRPVRALFKTSELPPAFFSREMFPSLALSFALQAAVWELMMQSTLVATALLVTTTALLTALAISRGAQRPAKPPSMPRAIMGVALTVILAAGLTVGGVTARLYHGSGWMKGWDLGERPSAGLIASARDLIRRLLFEYQAPPNPSKTVATDLYSPPPSGYGDLGADGFPGVILWPEVKPVPTLVAPLPAGGLYGPGLRRPMSIPFSGEVWIFKPPYHRPPLSSYFRRGSALQLSFSTVDHGPLEMEAHQKLDPAIDLTCCSKIQVEISNHDRYPGTVSLELILLDTTSLGAERSLGSAAVTPAFLQKLDFALPAGLELEQSNELKIVFHRERPRRDKSAKIAIERFVLVPRGM